MELRDGYGRFGRQELAYVTVLDSSSLPGSDLIK